MGGKLGGHYQFLLGIWNGTLQFQNVPPSSKCVNVPNPNYFTQISNIGKSPKFPFSILSWKEHCHPLQPAHVQPQDHLSPSIWIHSTEVALIKITNFLIAADSGHIRMYILLTAPTPCSQLPSSENPLKLNSNTTE